MKYLALLLFAFGALAQSTVTTVPNVASLVALQPLNSRPNVRVLGGTAPNDGGGGDFIWIWGRNLATNTAANGGPFAWPFGSAQGRWIRLTQYLPELKEARLSGSARVQSGGEIRISSGAALIGEEGSNITAPKITITGDPVDSTDAVTVGAMTQNLNVVLALTGVSLVNNKSALIGAAVSTSFARQCYVRNSTTGDGAAGMWMWDPNSTASESPTCVKSSNLSPSANGRWLKL